MAKDTAIVLGIAGSIVLGEVALFSIDENYQSDSTSIVELIPTVTITPEIDFPNWLRALPTIPVSEQIATTPEKTVAPAKILPTATFDTGNVNE